MIGSSSPFSPKLELIIQFLSLHSVRGISQPLDGRCLDSIPSLSPLEVNMISLSRWGSSESPVIKPSLLRDPRIKKGKVSSRRTPKPNSKLLSQEEPAPRRAFWLEEEQKQRPPWEGEIQVFILQEELPP